MALAEREKADKLYLMHLLEALISILQSLNDFHFNLSKFDVLHLDNANVTFEYTTWQQ